ncbi:MAG: hypothetical protein AAGF98_02425 [Cyanobacteria bacterium P01_H01_bin.153]
MSSLKVTEDGSYCYKSAIAHQLAATRVQDAATLAQHLADGMAAYVGDVGGSAPGQDDFAAITADLRVQPTPQGGLVLTLSPLGLAAWQQEWLQSSLPPTDMADEAAAAIAQLVNRGNWPLGDRLQLSLPMLLQWAYGRCHTWQQALERSPTNSQPQAVGASMSRPLIDAMASSPAGMDGALTHQLLPAVMQGLDQMAAHAGAPQVCLRQGYRLAEHVYHIDGQMARWRSETGRWAMMAAPLAVTKKGLGAILSNVFQLAPMPHL